MDNVIDRGPRVEAHARSSDPDTSHEAAASTGDVRASQAAVMLVLNECGPVTDETLVATYHRAWARDTENLLPRQSPSGIRSRRAELVRRGLVVWTGQKATMTTGRKGRVWAVKEYT